MIIKDIIAQPVIKTLEKADIWQMIKDLDIDAYNTRELNLEENVRIKLNVVMDSWDNNQYVTIYTILLDDTVIGVGGRTGDEEHLFNFDVQFIDKDGYIKMLQYINTLQKVDYGDFTVGLDYDFRV